MTENRNREIQAGKEQSEKNADPSTESAQKLRLEVSQDPQSKIFATLIKEYSKSIDPLLEFCRPKHLDGKMDGAGDSPAGAPENKLKEVLCRPKSWQEKILEQNPTPYGTNPMLEIFERQRYFEPSRPPLLDRLKDKNGKTIEEMVRESTPHEHFPIENYAVPAQTKLESGLINPPPPYEPGENGWVRDYVPGELLIKFNNPFIGKDQVFDLLKKYGAASVEERSGSYLARFDKDSDMNKVANEIRKGVSGVQYAHPNRFLTLDTIEFECRPGKCIPELP
jgi:hypothetical protein